MAIVGRKSSPDQDNRQWTLIPSDSNLVERQIEPCQIWKWEFLKRKRFQLTVKRAIDLLRQPQTSYPNKLKYDLNPLILVCYNVRILSPEKAINLRFDEQFVKVNWNSSCWIWNNCYCSQTWHVNVILISKHLDWVKLGDLKVTGGNYLSKLFIVKSSLVWNAQRSCLFGSIVDHINGFV